MRLPDVSLVSKGISHPHPHPPHRFAPALSVLDTVGHLLGGSKTPVPQSRPHLCPRARAALPPTALAAPLPSTVPGTQFMVPDRAGTRVKGMSPVIVLTGSISCSIHCNHFSVAAIDGTPWSGGQSLLDTGSRSHIWSLQP